MRKDQLAVVRSGWSQRPALVRGSLSHIGDLRAQLAFAEGDPGRAAHLAGAAEGLRRRSGFSTWPTLRRGEAELAAQARQALGDGGFGQAFASGSALSQQEAVAAVRDQPGYRIQPS